MQFEAMNNHQKTFFGMYLLHLSQQIIKRPEVYSYDIDHAPVVAGKMVQALTLGNGNKDSAAIRQTCKELKIPYTYKAIHAYLNESTPR